MKKLTIIFLLSIILPSCNSKWGDYGGYKLDYDSGIQYYIVLDKGQPVYANEPIEESVQNGILMKFHAHNEVDSMYLGRGACIIESFVLKNNIAFDSTFILVDQKPLDKIFGMVDTPYPHWKIEPTEELIKKSTFHQYWIIKKPTNDVYGPLIKLEYIEKRKELSVPENLRIKLN